MITPANPGTDAAVVAPLRLRHVLATTGQVPVDLVKEPASGVAAAALSIGEAQVQRGHTVELVGWRQGPPLHVGLGAVAVRTHPGWGWARTARWDLRWLAPMYIDALTRRSVDLLHVHVDPNLLLAPRARRRVFHLHTPPPTPMTPSYQRLLGRADAVIACSHFLREQFLAATGYPPERAFTVHNGVDARRFESGDGGALRREWGIAPEALVALFAGAVVPEKGAHIAVEAVRRLLPEFPNLHLVVIGSAALWVNLGEKMGDGPTDYERDVAGEHVHRVGVYPRGRMPAAFAAADLVVMPSVWDEPHPLVMGEAMAAGRPIAASTVGGMTETIRDGETGFLVPPANAEALAAALRRLLSSGDLRRRMGEQARQVARSYLTWERAAAQVDAVYRTVGGPGRKVR